MSLDIFYYSESQPVQQQFLHSGLDPLDHLSKGSRFVQALGTHPGSIHFDSLVDSNATFGGNAAADPHMPLVYSRE